MKHAVIIKTTGERKVVDLGDPSNSELSILQEVVGGWVQPVDIADDMTLWCNEEGKLLGLPMNYPAMNSTSASEVLMPGDVIAGDVIITGGTDDEGDTLGLREDQVSALMTA